MPHKGLNQQNAERKGKKGTTRAWRKKPKRRPLASCLQGPRDQPEGPESFKHPKRLGQGCR